MSLKMQLQEDMKNAMRARDAVALAAIRFFISELKNYEIDHGEQSDEGIQTLLQKQVKQAREAIAEFEKAGRTELVDEETAKVAILEKYLPQAISESEIEAALVALHQEQPNLALGNMIGAMKAKFGVAADGSVIARIAKQVLAS